MNALWAYTVKMIRLYADSKAYRDAAPAPADEVRTDIGIATSPALYVCRMDLDTPSAFRQRTIVASCEVDGDWNIPLYTRAAQAPEAAAPVAWIRFRSDGGYEGPIMDAAMEEVRKKSGAWTPLVAAPVASQPAGGVEPSGYVRGLLDAAAIARQFNDECADAISTQAGCATPSPAAAVQTEQASDYVLMPKHLTAENGAKSVFLGEFHETINVHCPDCDGGNGGEEHETCATCNNEGSVEQRVTVEWDTIKRIYRRAVELLAAPVRAQAGGADAVEAEKLPIPAPKDAKLWSDGIWRDSSRNELGPAA